MGISKLRQPGCSDRLSTESKSGVGILKRIVFGANLVREDPFTRFGPRADDLQPTIIKQMTLKK